MVEPVSADNLDTRALVADLVEAGLPTGAAAAVVTQINGAFKMAFADTAKKQDLEGLEQRLSARIGALIEAADQRRDGLEQRLAAKIEGFDQSLTAKIEGSDQRLSAKIEGSDQRLTAKIEATDLRRRLWLVAGAVSGAVTLLGLGFAAARLVG